MVPTLLAIGGPLAGTRFPVTTRQLRIGRDEANDVALGDPSIAPTHCVLDWDGRRLIVRDIGRGNPSFVNGLPAGDRTLAEGDRLRVGSSVFVVTFAHPATALSVQVAATPSGHERLVVMRREEALLAGAGAADRSIDRLTRELVGLVRISAAVNGVSGLVALERPLIELIADVLPAGRGAMITAADPAAEAISAVGWHRDTAGEVTLQVSRAVIERVLVARVGVMNQVGTILAAPLVAFDEVLGAIYLEADSAAEPFDAGHLRLLMSIAAIAATALGYERRAESLTRENQQLQAELERGHSIVGESRLMRAVYQRIARVAPTDATVLITGESGTGKELVARAVHTHSLRAARRFVAINCAAITETLLESELFGHEKGAFTGAVAQKKGKLEGAEGGTVFLDEVAELPPALQAKLLRALQEREFERVGGNHTVKVDFRLIAATNRDLAPAIAAGAFRKDLFYRLNVVTIVVPPLRDRPEDIPLLAAHFTRRHAEQANRRVTGVSARAVACLTAYDWPGNVRELENAIERAVVLGATELLLPDDLPEAILESGPSAASRPGAGGDSPRFHDAINQVKRQLIVRAVADAGNNYSAAARRLGLHPNYLHRLIRNLTLKDTLRKQP